MPAKGTKAAAHTKRGTPGRGTTKAAPVPPTARSRAQARSKGAATESKAPARAKSSRTPAKREQAKPVADGRPLRELARPDGGTTAPVKRKKADAILATKAREIIAAEFERAFAMKEKLSAEASIGGREKGRPMSAAQEKLRSIITSLEGMNRFALQMGLIQPAESRALYSDAMKRGLYEGWKR